MPRSKPPNPSFSVLSRLLSETMRPLIDAMSDPPAQGRADRCRQAEQGQGAGMSQPVCGREPGHGRMARVVRQTTFAGRTDTPAPIAPGLGLTDKFHIASRERHTIPPKAPDSPSQSCNGHLHTTFSVCVRLSGSVRRPDATSRSMDAPECFDSPSKGFRFSEKPSG